MIAGIFTDKYGNPDFKGLGPAFKTVFIVYLLYLILLRIKIFHIACGCFIILWIC